MKKFWLFIRWFFEFRGSTKVHPAMAFKYMPAVAGMNPSIAENIVHAKLGKIYKELTCAECGCTYYSVRKEPSPVCTTWPCYYAFHTRKSKSESKQND